MDVTVAASQKEYYDVFYPELQAKLAARAQNRENHEASEMAKLQEAITKDNQKMEWVIVISLIKVIKLSLMKKF